jgi:Rrf2 family protein
MLELALNPRREEGVYQKDIAVNQNVSVKYLDHIIAALKKAGLIINAGGKKSGYRLGRPAGEITIYDIYRAFDDELAIIDCLLTGGTCPRKDSCVLRDYWCDLNEVIRVSMESMTLEKLARRHEQNTPKA